MGFSIYYRSTKRIEDDRAAAIRSAADRLIEGRTWLSCEPVGFYRDAHDGHLAGGSKPNFHPHPDDVAAAAREGLPDGTVGDVIDILCQLSREQGVDWEFHHDYDPGPIGYIRRGVCEPRLRAQLEAIGELGDFLADAMRDSDEEPGWLGLVPPERPGEDDDGDEPTILPFQPRRP